MTNHEYSWIHNEYYYPGQLCSFSSQGSPEQPTQMHVIEFMTLEEFPTAAEAGHPLLTLGKQDGQHNTDATNHECY